MTVEQQTKKRVMLTVAYDGTGYCGWQIQPNGISVQSVLDRYLSSFLGEEIRVQGASRTDAGVHAQGNVAIFDTVSRMPADRISFAMNARLPEDIRIMDSREVPLSFHPRFTNTIKTYEYRICNRTFPDPCRRLYTLFYHWPLDENKMQQAADALTGEHDFTSFCTDRPEIKNHTRTIYTLKVTRQGDEVIIRITGNGFLYNMVRIIVGTLLRIGGGLMEPDEMKKILEAKNRALAGDTARPEGLTLVSIRYPDEPFADEGRF